MSVTAVAVSGGIDSLYALASLAEAGERVFALHARFLPKDLAPAGYDAMLDALHACCERIGVSLHVADCAEAFTHNVILPFVATYARGETPNPCAHCNATMKFGLLLDTALAHGADRIATGHYARLVISGGDVALYAGADVGKDQSYFLSLVPCERLAQARFPLASTRKDDIRAWLAKRELVPPAPLESQEICFVPNDEYRNFVPLMAERFGIQLPGPGPVLTPLGKKIATHKGLWQYTEGQRRGLGIAWSEPLYVCAKDMDSNALVVGGITDLHAGGEAGLSQFACDTMNYLVSPASWPTELLTRTRYRQKAKPASAAIDGAHVVVTEQSSGGPYTPGQLATVYAMETPQDAENSSDSGTISTEQPLLRVLGGGIIVR